MNTVNYHKELEKLTSKWRESGRTPSILLHSCCAPCSSYCLEYLTHFVPVTVFYFNPNITSKDEYIYRLEEQKRLIHEMPFEHPVDIIEGRYEPEEFLNMAKGLETAPERGPRCVKCYTMRLTETAKAAGENGFDYFATTLTLSPLKPAEVINRIGLELAPGPDELSGHNADGFYGKADKAGGIDGDTDKKTVHYLPTDFKKNGGYLRSIELSKQYNLYRQNYCGCIYSKRG